MTLDTDDAGGPTVRITAPIDFKGYEPATSAQSYTDSINANWSGQKGQYDVQTTLSRGPGGIVANIMPNPHFRSTGQVGGNNMSLPTLSGAGPAKRGVEGIAASHEFGHTLGLKDRYTNSKSHRGYENSIMGLGYSGVVDEKTVTEAIESCTSPQS
jgi:hypothetical protein